MKIRTKALGLAVVGLLLAATPVHGATKAKSKTTKKATKTATTGSTVKPASASTVQPASSTAQPASSTGPKGTLRMATFIDSTNWDPGKNSYALGGPIAGTLFDTLLRKDKDGNAMPGLALSYSQPDKRTYRFKLRPNVKFTDGTPWDAKAAKWNIERYANDATNPQQGIFAGLTDVVVVDPLTVDVKFLNGNPAFIFEIGGMGGSMVSPNTKDFARNPVGTGGWIYDKAASQEGVKYVFTANPDYWDKENQRYAKIEVYPIGDNAARVNALLTGKVDYIDSLPANRFEEVRKAGFKMIKIDNITDSMLIGDREGTIVPALGKVEVRRAMQYAFNQEAMIKGVFGGIGVVDNSVFRIGGPYYDPKNAKRYAYNKDKAKELLAKAGYPDGFEMTLATYPALKDRLEGMATVLADVGIRIKFNPVVPANYVSDYIKKIYPMSLYPFASGHPYTDWASIVGPSSAWNPFKVDNSIMNGLAARALDATTEAQRKKIYSDLEQAMQDEGVLLIMDHNSTLSAVRGDAKGDPYIYSGERGVRAYLVDIPVEGR